MLLEPLRDTRTANEETPKPPFRIGIIVNQFPVTDQNGNDFMMDELSVIDMEGEREEGLHSLRRFIEAEALEEIGDGFGHGPCIEFLIYPIG